MVDRASLISTLQPLAKPTNSQADGIDKALSKALAELILCLPLAAASALDGRSQEELAIVIRTLDGKTREKLAKNWEPLRKLDDELKSSLSSDLVDLVQARRPLYVPIKATLAEARLSGDDVSAMFSHAPVKDLAALLKKWDRHLRPMPDGREQLVAHLRNLLKGQAPSPKP